MHQLRESGEQQREGEGMGGRMKSWLTQNNRAFTFNSWRNLIHFTFTLRMHLLSPLLLCALFFLCYSWCSFCRWMLMHWCRPQNGDATQHAEWLNGKRRQETSHKMWALSNWGESCARKEAGKTRLWVRNIVIKVIIIYDMLSSMMELKLRGARERLTIKMTIWVASLFLHDEWRRRLSTFCSHKIYKNQ